MLLVLLLGGAYPQTLRVRVLWVDGGWWVWVVCGVIFGAVSDMAAESAHVVSEGSVQVVVPALYVCHFSRSPQL